LFLYSSSESLVLENVFLIDPSHSLLYDSFGVGEIEMVLSAIE